MPKVTVTDPKDIERDRFQQMWRDAAESTSPVEDLVELSRDLRDLEIRYGLTSEEFAAKFKRGEMGDAMDFIEWIGLHEMYEFAKKSIEIALMRAAMAYAGQDANAPAPSVTFAHEPRRVPA